MKKTGLYGYVYDFSVDHDAIEVDEILDINSISISISSAFIYFHCYLKKYIETIIY